MASASSLSSLTGSEPPPPVAVLSAELTLIRKREKNILIFFTIFKVHETHTIFAHNIAIKNITILNKRILSVNQG